ncbi:MAG: hypothetical protein GY822_29510 [Deltaproteobacteria bacterium]|nr:hypothetical protein [Deltaproteobacteria bacterium]
MNAFDDGVDCARAAKDEPILAHALMQRCQFLKRHDAAELAKEDFAEALALKGGALSFGDVQETKTLLAA